MTAADATAEGRPYRGSPPLDSALRNFAQAYLQRLNDRPHGAMTAVAREVHITRQTASRWAELCWERGYLTQVSRDAVASWSALQAGIDELRDQGRGPVCLNAWDLWASPRAEDQAEAVEACGWCPLLEACREYAVAAREPEGVWGGLTVRDRAALRVGGVRDGGDV